MKIYFTRHGQVLPTEFIGTVDFPKGDIPLSKLGKRQAACVGRELAAHGFAGVIYSSPYDRTATTANIIAEGCGASVYVDSALREKIFVEAEAKLFHGLTAQQLKERFPRIARDARLEYPWWTTNVDTIADIAERVSGFWDRILDSDHDEVFAVVHGATQVGSTYYFNKRFHLGLPEDVYELEEFLIPRFLNCNLSCIELDGKKELVSAHLLSTAHLSDELLTSNSNAVVRPEEIIL